MTSKNHVFIAIFSNHAEAETAIRKSQDFGLNIKKLSLLGKDYRQDEVVGRYRSNDHTRYWENLNSFSNEVWSKLSSVAFFHIPSMGPFLVGGPLASAIIGSLEGNSAVRGLSAIGSGLYILGITKSSIPKYEKAVKTGNYLVIVQGTEEQIAGFKAIVKMIGILEFDLHQV